MKSILSAFVTLLIVSGCAASMAGIYGVKKETDKFNNNQTKATMAGGVVDADYLGIVSNAAELNPFVVRSSENKVIATGILFSFENNTSISKAKWLNIREGSTATFLLNNGMEKIQLSATTGDFDYSVTAPQNSVYTTKFDRGVFSATPDQIERIANATSVEIRVSGASSYVDFPRKPNNHIVNSFLPNLKKFYETEVQPFLK